MVEIEKLSESLEDVRFMRVKYLVANTVLNMLTTKKDEAGKTK
jgi:hypothetical protein